MKTINIKGKEYVTVNERLKEFRNNFKDYALITEIVELGADFATVKASVIDDKGIVRATGFAREVIAKSPINKFAFLENCETSAIGRALGNFGIGIDEAVCTADELLMKLSQDEKPEPKPEKSDFAKMATAEKTANTKAVRKAVKEGETELPKKERSEDELKERFSRTMQFLVNVESMDKLSNSQIDFINNLCVELFEAGFKEQHQMLCDLYNKLQQEQLDDNANL